MRGGLLTQHAWIRYSQNGEEGVLDEILRRLGIAEGTFVEFGAGDGKSLSNTLFLAERGWKGVWIEQNRESFEQMQRFAAQFDVTSFHGTVWHKDDPDNHRYALGTFLVQATVGHGVPILDPTVVVIDIDSHDLEVFESLNVLPPVVLVEVNSTVPIGTHQHHGNGKEGASYTSMVEMATAKGYWPVCHTGNVFFVRTDLVPKLRLPEHEMLDMNAVFNPMWTEWAR